MEGELASLSMNILYEFATRIKLDNVRKQTKEEIVKRIIWRIEELIKLNVAQGKHNDPKALRRTLYESLLPKKIEQDPNALPEVAAENPRPLYYGNPQTLRLINMPLCFCGPVHGQIRPGITITCCNQSCRREFHHACLPWPEKDLAVFECPRCVLLHNDPLNPVDNVLCEPSLLANALSYDFYVDGNTIARLKKDDGVGIEVRMLKMDGIHFFEQTWPDVCTIEANGQTIASIKPLQVNSSLKKRKDQKIFNSSFWKLGTNSIKFTYKIMRDGKNTLPGTEPPYIFGVFLVTRLSPSALLSLLLSSSQLSSSASKQQISQRFKVSACSQAGRCSSLAISSLSSSLLCKLTYTPLQYPSRGLQCTHLDCFDLKYFIASMQSSELRGWACPLCKKSAYRVLVDGYILDIIHALQGKQPQKIHFGNDGDWWVDPAEAKEAEQTQKSKSLYEEEEDGCDVLSITSSDEENEGEGSMKTPVKTTRQASTIAHTTEKISPISERSQSGKTSLFNSDQNLGKRHLSSGGDDFYNDQEFLKHFWKHYESKRAGKKVGFDEFLKDFKRLCTVDYSFLENVRQLYGLVERVDDNNPKKDGQHKDNNRIDGINDDRDSEGDLIEIL